MSEKRMLEAGKKNNVPKTGRIKYETELGGHTFGANNSQAAASNVEPGPSGNHRGLFNANIMQEEQGYDNIIDSENEPFDEDIKKWALETYQNRRALNSLLAILRSHTDLKLPKDARTLLGTRQSGKEIAQIAGGELWYPGVRSVLNKYFCTVQPRVSSFSLNFFVEGLMVNRNRPKQFRPILMRIQEMPEVPAFVVANFYGDCKPKSAEEYLRPLVKELNELMHHGIEIAKKHIEIRVRAFIASPPARAFIKGVAYPNHEQGCQKCTVEGKFHISSHYVYFPGIDAAARTDADFRTLKYENHHRENTPLADLQHFDTIRDVISTDSRQQIDYGVTRTFVDGLKSGKLGRDGKWSAETVNKVNRLLSMVEIPAEVHRKFRSIADICWWKASEFHVFLHYASFVVFKHVLPEAEYSHFMLYYCAIRIFSSDVYREFWPEADRMLKQFVVEYGVLYGEHRVTINVHSLVHVYDDVCRFGPLKSFSSYPFEDKLNHVKTLLQNGHTVLVQAANGTSEQTSAGSKQPAIFPYLVSKPGEVALHVNANISLYPGNWFLSKDFYIVKYGSAQKHGPTVSIIGRAFSKIIESHTFHHSPMMHDIYEADISDLSTQVTVFLISDIKCKLVPIRTNATSFVFVPVIQTLTE